MYVIAEILEADGSSHTDVIAVPDSGTGQVAWKEQRDLDTEQTGVHTAVRDRLLVCTGLKKNLTVRDTATGRQVWTHRTTSTNYGGFALHGTKPHALPAWGSTVSYAGGTGRTSGERAAARAVAAVMRRRWWRRHRTS